MLESPWFPVVMLALVSVYAGWRASVFFRKGRPAIGIALVFLLLFCVYEAALRTHALLT